MFQKKRERNISAGPAQTSPVQSRYSAQPAPQAQPGMSQMLTQMAAGKALDKGINYGIEQATPYLESAKTAVMGAINPATTASSAASTGALGAMGTAMPYVGMGLMAGKALGLFNQGGKVYAADGEKIMTPEQKAKMYNNMISKGQMTPEIAHGALINEFGMRPGIAQSLITSQYQPNNPSSMFKTPSMPSISFPNFKTESIESPDDMMAMGPEASTPINYPTPQTAPMRSQQIPTLLGPRVGRGADPRLHGELERPKVQTGPLSVDPLIQEAIKKQQSSNMSAEQAAAMENNIRPNTAQTAAMEDLVTPTRVQQIAASEDIGSAPGDRADENGFASFLGPLAMALIGGRALGLYRSEGGPVGPLSNIQYKSGGGKAFGMSFHKNSKG